MHRHRRCRVLVSLSSLPHRRRSSIFVIVVPSVASPLPCPLERDGEIKCEKVVRMCDQQQAMTGIRNTLPLPVSPSSCSSHRRPPVLTAAVISSSCSRYYLCSLLPCKG